jgi:hypothetical protein
MTPKASGRRSASSSPVPDFIKHQVTARGNELLSRRFKVVPENQASARRFGFNYVIEVYGEWRGKSYYLCVKYRTSRGTPEEFLVRTTRLTHTGNGRFDLAYFRHTDRWQPVYEGLTVSECFETIEQEEIFWPFT